MTVTKKITNELGNAITVEVSTGVLREGRREIGPMIQAEIVGPNSQTSNMITPLEASTLRDCLIEELWRVKDIRMSGGRTLMMHGPLNDTERLEAVLLRLSQTTNLPREILVKFLAGVVEALGYFKVMLVLKPEATGYLTAPTTTGGYVDGSTDTPSSYPVTGGESPHGHGVRPVDVTHDTPHHQV